MIGMGLSVSSAGQGLPSNYWVNRWGVVEHWALNGSPAASISAANSLTPQNTPTYTTGKVYPQAAQLAAASSQYFSLADNAAVSTGDIDFWTAAWVYFDSLPAADQYLCTKYLPTGNQREWFMGRDNAANRLVFGVSTTGAALTTSVNATTFGAPSTATWYFVMVYHDSVNNLIGISVNGGAFDTAAHATGVFDSAAPFQVGALATPAGYMNGRAGPVTIGKNPPGGIAALPNEIRDRLYNGGAGRSFPFR